MSSHAESVTPTEHRIHDMEGSYKGMIGGYGERQGVVVELQNPALFYNGVPH